MPKLGESVDFTTAVIIHIMHTFYQCARKFDFRGIETLQTVYMYNCIQCIFSLRSELSLFLPQLLRSEDASTLMKDAKKKKVVVKLTNIECTNAAGKPATDVIFLCNLDVNIIAVHY